MTKGLNSKQRQEQAAERRAQVFLWREQGKTDKQIAVLMGVSEVRVWQIRTRGYKAKCDKCGSWFRPA